MIYQQKTWIPRYEKHGDHNHSTRDDEANIVSPIPYSLRYYIWSIHGPISSMGSGFNKSKKLTIVLTIKVHVYNSIM